MPRFFISYRRADSKTTAGRIYDRLVQAFGKHSTFKDVDNIPPGSDFRTVLNDAVAQCDVMLVIIGGRWLSVTDEQGRRRLDDPGDFVRIEVEAGLQRAATQVIPILVEGAPHPNESELPDTLKPLAYKNSLGVRDDPDFHRDMQRLIEHLRKTTRGRVRIRPLPAALAGVLALLMLVAAVLAFRNGSGFANVPAQGLSLLAAVTPASGETSSARLPAGVGDIVLRERFDDNAQGWELASYDYGRSSIAQGRMLLAAEQNAAFAVAFPSIRQTEFYVESLVTPRTARDIMVGFGIGSESANHLRLFTLGDNDGWLARFVDFGASGLTVLDTTPPLDQLWRAGDAIRMSLSARAGEYTLALNGEALIVKQLGAPPEGGQVFLVVQSPGDGAAAFFDDVVLRSWAQ